jgi:putative oxidoreductase
MRDLTDRLEGYAPTLLRVMAGIVFFFHGWSKLQNPEGLIGFVGSLGFPVPVFFGWLVILLETVGGLLLIPGLGVRWASLLLAVEMVFTTLLMKSRIGLIAPSRQPGVGAEIDLMFLTASLGLFILGAGELSVERNLLGRRLEMASRTS